MKQLGLFKSVYLENKIKAETDFMKHSGEHAILNVMNKVKVLVNSGFVEGKDFVNNTKIVDKVITKSLTDEDGSIYKEDIRYKTIEGSLYLLVNEIKKNDDGARYINKDKVSIWFENDKIQCSRITPQYRYYKATSILEKLHSYNDEVVNKMNRLDEKDHNRITKALMLQSEYPNAEVTHGRSSRYIKRAAQYATIEWIKIEFQSGSYMVFELDYKNELSVIEERDVFKETMEQRMLRYSKQENVKS